MKSVAFQDLLERIDLCHLFGPQFGEEIATFFKGMMMS